MRKTQWYVFAIGLMLLGMSFLYMTLSSFCSGINDYGLLTACYIRRYAYAIPGLICFALGFLFMFCAWLEKTNK